jgi:hypothetical protein
MVVSNDRAQNENKSIKLLKRFQKSSRPFINGLESFLSYFSSSYPLALLETGWNPCRSWSSFLHVNARTENAHVSTIAAAMDY